MHAERGDENLNARARRFDAAGLRQRRQPPQPGAKAGRSANRFYMYGVVDRLAMVAASYELGPPTRPRCMD